MWNNIPIFTKSMNFLEPEFLSESFSLSYRTVPMLKHADLIFSGRLGFFYNKTFSF